MVDFAGQPCEYQKIKKLAQKHKLLLIADACHALGATYNRQKIGALADLTILSFHPVKSITTGEGGAILTDNKEFYEHLLLLRSHGIKKDQNGFNVMTELGFNYRLTDIQAALGLSQLKKLDKFIAARQKVVTWYQKYLGNFDRVILPVEVSGVKSAWHIYIIRTVDPKDRLPLYNFLKQNGIGVNFHYPAVYSHPYYRTHGFAKVQSPEADAYHASAITLPLFPTLIENQVKKVSNLIKSYYAR